jgi:hypothetical protein
MFKIVFKLPTGMISKCTAQDLLGAKIGIVTQKHPQQCRSASSFLKNCLVFRPHVSANRTPGNTMIGLKCRQYSLPLSAATIGQVDYPVSMSLAQWTNFRKILHPARKVLKVAKEVKDALDGRIDFNGPFAVTHVNSKKS